MSGFAQRVYALISTIPRGKVSTYKEVAHALDTQAYRAVGNALRANPNAPTVPCHRVISTDRTLGGYQGATMGVAVRKKRKLLEEEGVAFDGEVRVSEACIHRF